jgi:hypothetical protein
MSIQTGPKRLLFNALTADSVNVASGVVTIQGLPPFLAVNAQNAFKQCTTACTPQSIRITPTIPSATCECPWLWTLKIVKKACTTTYRVQETFESAIEYNFGDPNGAPLTVNAIVTSIVAQINGNSDSIVTALAIGAPGAYTAFSITEKDCDSSDASCGFEYFVNSGTYSNETLHVAPILNFSELAREFAILPGDIFGNPQLARNGNYCLYGFRINPIRQVNDPHLADALADRYLDVNIYVNSDLANFAADWDTPLLAAIPGI